MRNITINTPDGKNLKITAPDDASNDQINEYAKIAITQYKAKQPASLGKQAWAALDKPREYAQKAITGLTNAQTSLQNTVADKTGMPVGTEPTGNLTRDVIANTPRIMGESAAEVLPSFVDRASILTAGAGGGLLKVAGKVAGKMLPTVAPMLEAGSGLRKGTLEAAHADPSIITDFGAKAKAGALYNEAKEGAKVGVRSAKVVSDAFKTMNEGTDMTAGDAFKARKVVRQMLRSKSAPYPTDDLMQLQDHLGEMVFRSANKGDEMYKRAIQGEQMRNVSRLNKNGTTGPISAYAIAKVPALAPLLSPALQGGVASATGAAAQMGAGTMAKAGMSAGTLVDQGFEILRSRKEKRRAR